MRAYANPDLEVRTGSVRVVRCPGALPTLPTQALSKSPQIVLINDKPPT
jgi:hypothetical protein